MFLQCCTIILLAALNLTARNTAGFGGCKQQPVKNKKACVQTDTSYNALKAGEKSKYQLTIKMGGLIQSKCPDSASYYKINVTLKNNSPDTLRYIDWGCSSDIWNIDNNGVAVLPPFLVDNCGDCLKNIIEVYEVPPGKEEKLYVYVLRTEHNAKGTLFRIGMILQRVLRDDDNRFYLDYFFSAGHRLSAQKMNMIWSNPIQMP